MQVLIAVALRVASKWSPGQTAVGEGSGRQSESAKLRGGRGGLAPGHKSFRQNMLCIEDERVRHFSCIKARIFLLLTLQIQQGARKFRGDSVAKNEPEARGL